MERTPRRHQDSMEHMSIPDTYAPEPLLSSPERSVIDLATDGQHDSDNVYSFEPVDTLKFSKTASNTVNTEPKSLPQSQVITLDSSAKEEGSASRAFSIDDEDVIDDSSGLFEVSQKEFLNSQKQTLNSQRHTQHKALAHLDKFGDDSSERDDDLRSGQSPLNTPQRAFPTRDIITSSSPVATQTQETQPLPRGGAMAPSAQLTSFRMQSPVKIKSAKTTPKKRNFLVKQDSYTLPHLLSPTKSTMAAIQGSSPSKEVTTPKSDLSSSPSIYCTARQTVNQEPESPQYTIKTSAVKFKGKVSLQQSSPFGACQTRVIPVKRAAVEEILDTSDDDGDESGISIIEITRTVKKQKRDEDVVLQVPSSQGPASSLFSSPLRGKSPLKMSPLKNTLTSESRDGSPTRKPKKNTTKILEEQDEFDLMSMEQLRQKSMHFGLKNVKSKAAAAEALRQISKFLSQESIQKLSESQNINHSQNIVKTDLFAALNEAIVENKELWEKIYTFEPMKTPELLEYFEEKGFNIKYELFKDWCDHNSICLTDEFKKNDDAN